MSSEDKYSPKLAGSEMIVSVVLSVLLYGIIGPVMIVSVIVYEVYECLLNNVKPIKQGEL